MSTKEIPILQTKDYSIFTNTKGNRKIDQKHVNQLIQSMKEHQWISPIQINEKYEIIDGAHRLSACKALKLPVHYYIVKGANLTTIQTLNSNSKDWRTEDYLESWIEQGVKDYVIYKQFKDAYGFAHRINLALLVGTLGNEELDTKFKTGEFKVKDIQKATEVAAKLTAVEPFYKGFKRRNFAYAIIRCLKNKNYNHDTFLHKLEYQQRKMVDCSNVEQYLELIEEIYNYKSRQEHKVSLRLLK